MLVRYGVAFCSTIVFNSAQNVAFCYSVWSYTACLYTILGVHWSIVYRDVCTVSVCTLHGCILQQVYSV